jgi:hypothetical protein
MGYYNTLRREIQLTPIEEMRASLITTAPAAEAEEVNTDGDTPGKEEDSTVENNLYQKFAERFPRFMSGEFWTLRLEAPHAKPLELEWIFGDRISIAHTYELNGEPAFEPRIELYVYSKAKKLEALYFETTDPPRKDSVYYKGVPNTGRQQNIHKLLEAWLDRVDKQQFRPVSATIDLGDEDMPVTFDADGNALFPSGEIIPVKSEDGYNLTYWQGGSGVTVLNNLDAQNEDHEELARISPDHSIKYYKDVPAEVKARIESYAQTAEIPDMMPEKQYDLGYGFLGNGLTVWNRAEEKNGDYVTVAHIDPDRSVTFYDKDMPHDVKEKIDAVAKSSDTRAFGFSPAPEVTPPTIEGAAAPTSVYEAIKKVIPETAEPKPAASDNLRPDPLTSDADRDAYGYTYEEMLPMSPARAAELFDANLPIFLLYTDDSEAAAFNKDEILNHDGLCGVERRDWECSMYYISQTAIEANAEGTRESELIHGDGNRFGIYQIKGGQEMREYIMDANARHREAGLVVSRGNYELVYTAPLPDRIEFLSDRYPALNRLYTEFNTDHPADYTGRSLSITDVVVLKYNGDLASFYVDGGQFVEIDGFLGDETQWAAALQREQERGGVIDFPVQAPEAEPPQSFSQSGKSSQTHGEQPHKPEQAAKRKPSLLGKLEQNKQRVARNGDGDAAKPKELEV